MYPTLNPQSERRLGREKPVPRRSLPLTFPWWDLSEIKLGLDRKQFED